MILAPLNILLFFIALVFLVPKDAWKKLFMDYKNILSYHVTYVLLIIIVVIIHLIEVNIIDPYTTELIGHDFTPAIELIEGGSVQWFSEHWTPMLLYFFVFIYIGLYPFLLWFSPLYFIVVDNKKAIKIFAYALIVIYTITLPFYLFFPVTNVYTYYGLNSALTSVIPTIEQFFYTTTTNNNCFPSLHVAVSLLIAKTASFTNNKRFIYLTYFCAIGVISAVIYLAIHWITDIFGGILLAFGAFYLVKRFIKGDINDPEIKTN
jgi:membrane-associated phospholipid phosphatase